MRYTVHCSEQSINADSTERTALNVNTTETPAINADSADTAAVNVDSIAATYTSANKHTRTRGKAMALYKNVIGTKLKCSICYTLVLPILYEMPEIFMSFAFCTYHSSFEGGGVGGVGKV